MITFKNEMDGVESHVTKGDKGFHVSLKDSDSGEFLSTVLIYQDEDKAIDKAKEIIG